MKTEHYLILSLIFLSILSGAMYYNTVLVDTQAYVPSVYYLQDKFLQDDDITRVETSYAFKRPVEIAFASIIEPIIGVRQSYSLTNLILLCITSVLTYFYLRKLFKNHEQKQLIAYVGAILCATALPLIIYATRVLVDVAGYVTLLLGLIIIDYFLEKKYPLWTDHLKISLLIGFFLLVRDAAVILYPYYILKFLLRRGFNLNYMSKKIWSLWPLIFTLVPQLIFMWWFDVGFLLAGKSTMITSGKYSLLGWLKFFIVHFAAFHIAWLFAILGLINDKDKTRRFFYSIFSLSAVIYLVGIQFVALTSPRFSMVLFPVVFALAAYGIIIIADKLSDKIRIIKINQTTIILVLLVIYASISFIGAWLYPAHGLISEDAGGDIVLKAVFNEIQLKIGGLFA